ncbi:hypothetical protein GE21DRAFT_1047334 [Neurospora crassa]|nr:hypothetical protein GE21DRAFT_1047334 [Neurospora crassa]
MNTGGSAGAQVVIHTSKFLIITNPPPSPSRVHYTTTRTCSPQILRHTEGQSSARLFCPSPPRLAKLMPGPAQQPEHRPPVRVSTLAIIILCKPKQRTDTRHPNCIFTAGPLMRLILAHLSDHHHQSQLGGAKPR